MPGAAQKVIEIIYDLLFIGKTAAKEIQISTDARTARRIKKAIAENDLKKLKKIATSDGVYIDEKDILGIGEKNGIPFIEVSPEYIVRDRQMFKDIRRYKRAKGA